jgi:hypothetical protein
VAVRERTDDAADYLSRRSRRLSQSFMLMT